MTHLYWLIDETGTELSPFTEILIVKVGSTSVDQKILQKVNSFTKSNPTRFYFSVRNNSSSEFIYKLTESGFHPIREVSIGEVWRKLKNENCQSFNR